MARVNDFRQYSAQCLAEFFGTFILILFGEAAIAQYKFSRMPHQSNLIINLSFGIGVYTALMIAGAISGAHLNPAVSISLMTIRKLKPMQCLFYIIGQLAGAFCGALLVYFLYYDLFNHYDGGVRAIYGANGTGDIFFTMPAPGVHRWTALLDQIVGTAILMIFIMSVGQESNRMISDVAKPFAFVLVIVAITSGFAANTGAAINPARDLGPRLFGGFVYGWEKVFRTHHYFFWIPIIGPIIGAILGVWLYEGYTAVVERYANLPNITNIGSVEIHPKVVSIEDDDHEMITHKLRAVHS